MEEKYVELLYACIEVFWGYINSKYVFKIYSRQSHDVDVSMRYDNELVVNLNDELVVNLKYEKQSIFLIIFICNPPIYFN